MHNKFYNSGVNIYPAMTESAETEIQRNCLAHKKMWMGGSHWGASVQFGVGYTSSVTQILCTLVWEQALLNRAGLTAE